MIDEEMNSSYGEEEEAKENIQMEDTEDQNQLIVDDTALNQFDEFNQFRYNEFDAAKYDKENKTTIDLKDLTENNFIDLLAAKNQDKRFYSWLHFHPLFDDEDWGSEGHHNKMYYQKYRRGSEQIKLNKEGLLQDIQVTEEEDFFTQLYAGIPALFDTEDKSEAYGFINNV